MEIIKYASKNCVKCKVLDRVLASMKLEVQTKYLEDEGVDKLEALGIKVMPTLIISNEGKEVRLSNAMTPQMIKEAITKVSA